MYGTGQMDQENTDDREQILDTVDRVSELCFGLFMALTFVGAVSATSPIDDAGRKMFYTALGCNLAWGLADAVMFLVRTLTNRGRRLTLVLTVRRNPDANAGVSALREALPTWIKPLVADTELEPIRARLAALPDLPGRPRFLFADVVGAVAIFLLVVASTFPVALPFVVLKDVPTALIVSRVLTIVMLFGSGIVLGKSSGFGGWKAGLAMAALGVVLTMAIIALGG